MKRSTMTMIHRLCLEPEDKLYLKGYYDSMGSSSSSSSSFTTLDVVTVLPSIGEHEQVLNASLDNISETTTARENKIERIKLRVQQRRKTVQRQQSSQQITVGRRRRKSITTNSNDTEKRDDDRSPIL